MSTNATMGKLVWWVQRSMNVELGSTSFNGIRFGGTPAALKRIENSILIGIPLIGSIIATEHIFRCGLSLIDLSAFLIFYLFVGLGTALGLHRYFSHRSFDTTPVIAFLLGAFGSMAFQGSVLRWVVGVDQEKRPT